MCLLIGRRTCILGQGDHRAECRIGGTHIIIGFGAQRVALLQLLRRSHHFVETAQVQQGVAASHIGRGTQGINFKLTVTQGEHTGIIVLLQIVVGKT